MFLIESVYGEDPSEIEHLASSEFLSAVQFARNREVFESFLEARRLTSEDETRWIDKGDEEAENRWVKYVGFLCIAALKKEDEKTKEFSKKMDGALDLIAGEAVLLSEDFGDA